MPANNTWDTPTWAAGKPEATEGVRVACPKCRRMVSGSVLLDVTTLPAPLRAQCGWSVVDYVCDACQHAARLTGKTTLTAVVEALGAPQDIVARATVYDTAHQANQHGKVISGHGA